MSRQSKMRRKALAKKVARAGRSPRRITAEEKAAKYRKGLEAIEVRAAVRRRAQEEELRLRMQAIKHQREPVEVSKKNSKGFSRRSRGTSRRTESYMETE